MSRDICTLVALVFVVSSIDSAAYAQSIAPCQAYWAADAVFTAQVTAVKQSAAVRVASVRVLDGFRGVNSSTAEVMVDASSQRCRTLLRTGREYMIYATRSSAGALEAVCSRTRDVEDAASDLSYARDVRQGSTVTGFIGGRVLVAPVDLAGRPVGAPTPAPGINVTVTRDAVRDLAVTDVAGEYRVVSHGPGAYRVTVEVPDRFYSTTAEMTVDLPDARACADVSPVLHQNGRIAGRVVDAGGGAVAGLTIELGSPTTGKGVRVVTDRNGAYDIARLPPGRFVLSVPAGPARGTSGATARLYYPGVDAIAKATRVAVTPGQRSSVADFRLPPQHQYVSISGVVLDASGAPAEGARVYLKGSGSDDDRIVSEPVSADFMGRFVIAARTGAEYVVFAERPRAGERSARVDSTDPQTLTIAAGMKPLRLVLLRRY